MGRQICLRYLDQDGRTRLLAHASHTGDGAYFIPGRFPERTPPLLSAIGDDFVGSIVRRSDVSRLVVDDVPSQGYWYVDVLRSPAIECNGRLWFSTGYWDSKREWVSPDDDWLRWANGLLRWVRSHFTRNLETGCYEGSGRRERVGPSGDIAAR